ncbi:hypothetical protein ABIA39_000900 [Nocardia sp. GAS34]|jgi:hypothetical protein|uniref:hypothetical protein n=1 Tax=unclassified Nocardia TaxID=2637762 RepID=UPI003D26222C
MSSISSHRPDVGQFREIADRVVSLIQASSDRPGTLNQFIEAMSSAEMFTDLLIAYANRWFVETGGQSILLGPEMFWLLSSPDARGGTVIADAIPEADTARGSGERSRKMLLICLFESLAHQSWPSIGIEPRIPVNGVA